MSAGLPERLRLMVLVQALQDCVRAAEHWSACDFPDEVAFRCEGCRDATRSVGSARKLVKELTAELAAQQAAQQLEPPAADPSTVTVRWACPRPSCGREHEWEWSNDDVPLGGAISRMHCESCPAVTPMVAHRVPGGVRMIEPEAPAAGELPGEAAVKQAVDLIVDSLWATTAHNDRNEAVSFVRQALRPLLASAPAEGAAGTFDLADEIRKRLGYRWDGAAHRWPVAPAEVEGWEDVVSAVSRVLGEPTGNGIWANLVLDAIGPLWPPARLEAVRELAAELDGKAAGNRRIEERHVTRLERAGTPCVDGSWMPETIEQQALLTSWELYGMLADEQERVSFRLRKLLGLPPQSPASASAAQASPSPAQEPATPSGESLGGKEGEDG